MGIKGKLLPNNVPSVTDRLLLGYLCRANGSPIGECSESDEGARYQDGELARLILTLGNDTHLHQSSQLFGRKVAIDASM